MFGTPYLTSGGFTILKLGAGLELTIPPPFLPSSPSPSHPLSSTPPIAARGSRGALKLPQRVQAEPGRQTLFGAF